MMKHILLALVLTTVFTPVSAKSIPLDRAEIESTIAQINPAAKVSSIKPSAIDGLAEVVADGTVIYISNDGKYIVHGVMLDVANRTNLTEVAGSAVRKQVLAAVPDVEKIIYRPTQEPKYKVSVFTDVSCGYCKLLHENMSAYLEKGIQIEYLAYPRGMEQSPAFGAMQSIWCSVDRNKAFTDVILKSSKIDGKPCLNPVSAHYELGERIGVDGTPAIYTTSGMKLGGFLTPDQLLEALEKLSKKTAGN